MPKYRWARLLRQYRRKRSYPTRRVGHFPGINPSVLLPMQSSVFIPFRRSCRTQPCPPLYFYYESNRNPQPKKLPPISGHPSDSVVVLPQNRGNRRGKPPPRACADRGQPRPDGWPHFMPAVLPQKAVYLVRRRDDAPEGSAKVCLQ